MSHPINDMILENISEEVCEMAEKDIWNVIFAIGNEFGIVTFSTNVFFEPNVSEIYFDSSISTFGNFPFAVITFPPTLTSGNVSSASVGNLAKALVSTKSYDSLLID